MILAVWNAPPDNVWGQTEAKKRKQQEERALLDRLAETYRLSDGQIVARFTPPFPSARKAILSHVMGERAKFVTCAWFYWQDEKLTYHGVAASYPAQGVQIDFNEGAALSSTLEQIAAMPKSRMIGRADLLEKRISGDFVWAPSAPPEQAAAELAKLVGEALETRLQFKFIMVPSDVIVCRNSKDNGISRGGEQAFEIKYLDARVGFGTEECDWKSFIAWLEWAMNLPVIDETQGYEDRQVRWKYSTYVPTRGERERGWSLETAVPAKRGEVLKTISAHAGADFRLEQRPMRMLQISVEE
jgi:hypothetical protein